MVGLYGFHVGKYTRPIDGMGIIPLKTNMEPKNEGLEDDFPFK